MMTIKKSSTNGLNKSTILKDADYIKKACNGDVQAREELAKACFPRVQRLVNLSMAERNDIEDVIQIAMVTAFKDLSTLRHTDRFIGWLDKVVCNVVRTEGRKRTRFRSIFTLDSYETETAGKHHTPEELQNSQELFEKFKLHLAKINWKKRMAITLSLFFGYIDAEVASTMDCTIETAKKRIQNGKKEFLEKLQKDSECLELLKEVSR